MESERLANIVSAFDRQTVLVVGDCMMDEYLWGSVSRISPEAPVPVVDVQNESITLGGAANVASNVVTLGGRAKLVGVIGGDREGGAFLERMDERGLERDGILVTDGRPTTVKTRIVAHSQHVVRADRELRGPLAEAENQWVRQRVVEALSEADALIVSDYGKGVLSAGLLEQLIPLARRREKMIAVDPKMSHFPYYSGASVITPNKREAGQAAHRAIDDESTLQEVGWRLLADLNLDALLITRGEEGMSLFEKGGAYVHLPTRAREVYDVTGAGDTVISTLTLAVSAGASMVEAAEIANHAALIAVGQVGTTSVTRRALLEAFAS